MKDLFLISIILAVFVFDYFVMAKIDSFIEEKHRQPMPKTDKTERIL